MKVIQINSTRVQQPSFQAGKITYFSLRPEEITESMPGSKEENYIDYNKTLNKYIKRHKNNFSYVQLSNKEGPNKVPNHLARADKIIANNGTEVFELVKETNNKDFFSYTKVDSPIKPKNGETLSQIHHIEAAIKEAKANNDLVILRGSEKIANPFLYMKDYTNPNSEDLVLQHYSKLKEYPKFLISFIESAPEKYKDIIKEYNELPLMIISSDKTSGKNGINQKYADTKHIMLYNIKTELNKAIKTYAKTNKEFKNNIPKTMLLQTKKIVGTIVAIGLLIAGYAGYKHHNRSGVLVDY